MTMKPVLILEKELLLIINYYENGDYTFHTSQYEFHANSDNDYPYCLTLDSTSVPV